MGPIDTAAPPGVVPAGTICTAARLLRGRRFVALTGAGISTDSGIPDYRGPNSPARTPMSYQEFRSGGAARQRYWARSHLGWQRMSLAQPNDGHRALARLASGSGSRSENSGLDVVITQNVDGLHQRAGSPAVIDLHGRIDEVICLQCGAVCSRSELHARLAARNPGFGAGAAARTAPDGDTDLVDTAGFVVAGCTRCAGDLKPNVVFFGENVPREKVERCYAAVDDAQAMLVAGSSLTVMSGLRFVKYAARQGKPIIIVNRGATRGDAFATLRIDAGCSPTLYALADELLR